MSSPSGRLLSILLIGLCWSGTSPAQTAACAAFAPDGALATATIRYGSDIDIRLAEPGGRPLKSHLSIASAAGCELAFSGDGAWVAAAIHSDALAVVLIDRKSGHIAQRFSSKIEPPDSSAGDPAYLVGFLPDDSLVLRHFAAPSSALAEHIQTWSLKGEMISDQPLADAGARAGYQPLLTPGRPVVAVTGDGARNQMATLSNPSGPVLAQVALPMPGNHNAPLLGVIVRDQKEIRLSPDGQFAAIARTLFGQLILATDHDWGSEIELLGTSPLRLIANRKTGVGGIQALAIDHRDNLVRVVGFWNNGWHDLRLDPAHTATWTKAKI